MPGRFLLVILWMLCVCVPGMASRQLIYAEEQPAGTIAACFAEAFGEALALRSAGELTTQIYYAGVLGSGNQLLGMAMEGDCGADFFRVPGTALHEYGCVRSKVLDVPYLFPDGAFFAAFVRSEAGQAVLAEPAERELPFVGISLAQDGFRHFFTTKPIQDVSELAGKRMRVTAQPADEQLMCAMGAEPVKREFAVFYMSLMNGEVFGGEQTAVKYESNSLYEVAPYLLTDAHLPEARMLLMTRESWESLSEEERRWVTDAGKDAAEACRETADLREKEALERLAKRGTIITAPGTVLPEAREYALDRLDTEARSVVRMMESDGLIIRQTEARNK